MNPTSKLKFASALLLTALLSACTVDDTGLIPPDIEGNVYNTNCRVVIDHRDPDTGAPRSTILLETQQVCSNGAPNIELLDDACATLVRINMENFEMMYPGYAGDPYFEVVDSTRVESETCQLSPWTDEGDGEVLSRTDMLVDTAADLSLLNDDTGQLLGKNSITNSLAVLVDSEIQVGAKFAKWRYADTTAQGEIDYDRFNCNAAGECDIVLRSITLQFADFTIVRPTVFARDVPVRDARLYSIKNYATRTDSAGRFTIGDVDAIVSSVIDGEKINLLNTQGLTIEGQFADNLHGQSHAALMLNLSIKDQNEQYSVSAKAKFQTHKFPTKLANGKDGSLCLTDGPKTIYREARVADCSYKKPHQVWSFELKGRYLRIRQPFTNMCLNVKSASENYDGGIVSIVNCSDHWDQLWAVDNDFNVINLHTQKCLDVGGNKNRNEDDLVTINACNSKISTQDWAVRRPS
ncbi:RICIN domain-containing protein [Arenicella xantha]|uniref:Ricin-type beta-trefoil lectin protein n=1 Tax=Arenicella xantha TaxID=644221 RepID=A0A395JGT6_9GAMM|nr:RICIN domain-containing protein [Arenicella xantha]RBP48739.1 ricin-type beta-trefoil lectin protein [Arenicella xantha]